MTDKQDNPGINLPPPPIYVVPLVLELVLNRRVRLPFLPRGAGRGLGRPLLQRIRPRPLGVGRGARGLEGRRYPLAHRPGVRRPAASSGGRARGRGGRAPRTSENVQAKLVNGLPRQLRALA